MDLSRDKIQDQIAPWRINYGLGRSLIAFATLLTLFFNDTNLLFKSAAGISECPACADVSNFGIFCVLGKERLEIARWICIGILIITITGRFQKLTGILHWWVSFSLVSSAMTLDGGDQVASVLTLLLIPVTLTDPRRSHWHALHETQRSVSFGTISGDIAMSVVKLQVAIIYFHASVGKFKVTEWINGTANYYFFVDPLFGGASESLISIFKNPYVMVLSCWLVLLLELGLSLSLLLSTRFKAALFLVGCAFHISIMVFFGLISFGLTMMGALCMYLMSEEVIITLKAWLLRLSWIKRHGLPTQYHNA